MYQKSLLQTSAHFTNEFPPTKFMGSKQRLLPFIFHILDKLKYETVLDAFSGSGCVAFEFKRRGKSVTTNDFLYFSYLISKALIENRAYRISQETLPILMESAKDAPQVVKKLYADIFFTPEECDFLDSLRYNIEHKIDNEYTKALAISAACRACQKKRPRGIFTFTGRKSWDSRNDLKMTMKEQFEKAVAEFNAAVFDNNRENKAHWGDILALPHRDFDLVYIDPPYWSPLSDNDYVRRYHFIEGYARQWKGLAIDMKTKVRKFKSYESPFSDLERAKKSLLELFARYSSSTIALSYSSNGFPSKGELCTMLGSVKRKVTVYEKPHRYSFGNQGNKALLNNLVKEYIIIGEN